DFKSSPCILVPSPHVATHHYRVRRADADQSEAPRLSLVSPKGGSQIITMPGDLSRLTTLMFDFYGTVVDMQTGLTEAITPYLREKGYTASSPSRVVTWWRRAHFESSMIDALLHRDHTPYKEIGHQAVDYTLQRAGIPHTSDEVANLVSQIERLKPFLEVVEALTVLKQRGYSLVVLSNGDPDML